MSKSKKVDKRNILNGSELAKAFLSGAKALVNAKNKIDALNVFPVPDGDTGTNMSSTIAAAIPDLEKAQNEPVYAITKKVSTNMIYEARGNSGVILSQIFKGFALGTDGKVELNTQDLIQAFEKATEIAYKSVFKPVEGTILTVIRETTENLKKEFEGKDIHYSVFFEEVVAFARKSCDETPNKLKNLREVGVTDSGGEGLYTIFWGMNEALHDRPVELKDNSDEVINFIGDSEVYEGEFGYCTEVLIDLTEPAKFKKANFVAKLEKLANSLVVVSDDNILKVHGHTVKPGDMLNFTQQYGEFIKIKSENMTLQANYSKANAEKLKESQLQHSEESRTPCGIISCNLGSGIVARMKDLGCDFVVESGQTQNPSAQDLINAVNNVNSDSVFILTNNSNIILVAQQVAQVIQDKNVIIIPTKTQIQGITAMLNFNHESSVEENVEMMNEAIANVTTGEITKAIRNTKLNGVQIKDGDYLSIINGKITASSSKLLDAAKKIVKKAITEDKELVTIYYGDESSLDEAEEILNFIESNYDIEVEIIEGNQPTYQFIIGVE
ncbi:DAK2 domain-containing protein [Mycoplasma sp. 2045]|uniref:DAK2 domain-containing protein n=1 Tax=Mycoplasma sp. 2045 TaxID=2967301 RepID=UPI00211BA234|nr:DAK2 domain-containing protein [Mycoplasma sp. 2045]UUM20357.1 DAK2 domain-containing protein [Mycoplasma sp. 2045]